MLWEISTHQSFPNLHKCGVWGWDYVRVCSIHRYGEAVVYAQMVCHKLKPHLLLSNCCHVEYSNLALSLSLNSWLTKSWVLFIVREGNLHLGLTSVGWVHTVSRVSQEPPTAYSYDTRLQRVGDTVRAQAISQATKLRYSHWYMRFNLAVLKRDLYEYVIILG